MIDLQTLSIVLASIGVTIAAIYYTFTLRYTMMNMKNTPGTRQAQMWRYTLEYMKTSSTSITS